MSASPSLDSDAAIQQPGLALRRRIKAPPARVYAAWTDPDHLMRWWGPANCTGTRAEIDARVGGRFRIAMTADSGEVHEASGVYREVVPDERLVFTWTWRSTPERESLVTIRLAPDGEGTLLTLIHERLFGAAVRDDHRRGWDEALDKLERRAAEATL